MLLVALGLVPFVLLGGLGLLIATAAVIVSWLGPTVGPTDRRMLRRAWAVLLVGLIVWRGAVFVLGVLEVI